MDSLKARKGKHSEALGQATAMSPLVSSLQQCEQPHKARDLDPVPALLTTSSLTLISALGIMTHHRVVETIKANSASESTTQR